MGMFYRGLVDAPENWTNGPVQDQLVALTAYRQQEIDVHNGAVQAGVFTAADPLSPPPAAWTWKDLYALTPDEWFELHPAS